MATYSEREVINGKPHFGLYFGSCIIINAKLSNYMEERGVYAEMLARKMVSTIPDGCESRHEVFVLRPPTIIDPLTQNATIASKYMIWGRAHKIMRLIKKGKKRYKKVIVGGRIKRVRIDKK